MQRVVGEGPRVWSSTPLAVGVLLLVLAFAPAPSRAADISNVCAAPASAGATPQAGGTDPLVRAAELGEDAVRGPEPPTAEARGALQSAMSVGIVSAPSAASQGAYCAALGELVRRGWIDAPRPANLILRTAFQDYMALGEESRAAIAAYRLSLALAALATDAQNPAARGSPTGSAASDGELLAERTGAEACRILGAPDRDVRGPAPTPSLASQCSASLAASAGDTRQAAISNLTLARQLVASAALSRGDAPARLARAVTVSEASLGPDGGTATGSREVVGRLVETAIDAGATDAPRLDAAIDWMAAAPPEDLADRAEALALRGRVAILDGQAADARAFLRGAIRLESERATPARLPDWYLLLAQADPAHRREAVSSAYSALQAVRPLLPLRDALTGESTFELHMRDVFVAAVDVELASGRGDVSPSAIVQAQQIVESYRQAEIDSYFGNECAPPRTPIEPAQLRSDEVILYPVLLSDRVELLYASGSEAGVFKRLAPNTGANAEAVASMVDELRRAMQAPGSSPAVWRPISRRLYDLLIAPIEARLGPQSTLIVVPDGVLRLLPFGALIGPDGRFLVERARVAVTPALAYSQPGLDRLGPSASIAAAALGGEVTFNQIVYSSLSGADAEARAAAMSRAHNGRPGYLVPQLTKADLQSVIASGRFNVLHLATHASFNASSGESYIVARDQLIRLDALRQMLVGANARGAGLDLIVLSACDTAVGDDEASMGLAGAAVEAGAHAAIASLWQVNDASTADLMGAFYASYRGGASKAQALRTAQLALIADPRYRDPYYWAAFTLIGAWR